MFLHFRSSLPTKKNLQKLAFLKKLYSFHQKKVHRLAFTRLPWIEENFTEIKLPKKNSAITVIGMGGASLGSQVLTSTLIPSCHVDFLDNVDPYFIKTWLSCIPREQNLAFFISKSGETLEVLSLAAFLFPHIAKAKKALVITDRETSSLGKLAKKWRVPIMQSDKKIPGRFSVLSAVSLLPAGAAGIDGNLLKAGARATSWEKAYELACLQYLYYRERKNIVVIFPYAERLGAFSDWYIQLLAESIGKSKRIGITPIKAMGVKDQHSQLQLFLDGPDDKFYIFLKPQGTEKTEKKIPGKKYSFQQLFDAEYNGVIKAFSQRRKPLAEIKLHSFNEETLGELLFFFELEVAFLGSLLNVNIENQPAVEESKKITKTLLKKM